MASETCEDGEAPGAEHFLPVQRSLGALRSAVQGCQGCPRYKCATQAVFGEGPDTARLVIVGEVPGDVEDRDGHPFVGPAGRLLRDGLAAAAIDLTEVYLTNAVKHFAYTMRGKRRIHSKPRAYEIEACKPWLDAELEQIDPDAILLLGAVAVSSLLGRSVQVMRDRGRRIETAISPATFVTVHPSAVLRAGDARAEAKAAFLADLAIVARYLEAPMARRTGDRPAPARAPRGRAATRSARPATPR
jgi:uracil-DNA glycosylase